jgi:hypothetical protein
MYIILLIKPFLIFFFFVYWIIANYQQSSRLLSFVGSNCLLHLPSLSNEANIKSNTIMDVTLIKSIKNTYSAPILKQMNLLIEVKYLLFLVNSDTKLFIFY